MKYFFVARLYGLKLNRTLNKGIKIMENIRISTNGNILKKVCDKHFGSMIGDIELNELYNGPFIYAEGLSTSDVENDKNKRLEFLDYFMKIGQLLSSALWLIKDNSISTDQGFLYIYDDKFDNEKTSVSSNGRTPYFFNSYGKRVETEYSFDEISGAIKLQMLFDNESGLKMSQNQIANRITTGANRLERFYYFIQSARSEAFLPNKISTYCTALETLLSTDNQEISHKISERVARILGKDLQSREELFSFIKVAYSIRSSNVHGDKLSKKYRTLENQAEIARELDDKIRDLYGYILSNEELFNVYLDDNNNQLNHYFNKLILS